MKRIGDGLATLCGGLGIVALTLALFVGPDARVAAFITEDPPPDGGGSPACSGAGTSCIAKIVADDAGAHCEFSGMCSTNSSGVSCQCTGTASLLGRGVLQCTPRCFTQP